MANREIKKVSIGRDDFQKFLDECTWSINDFAKFVDRDISTIRRWTRNEMFPTYAYNILMHRVRLGRKENIYIRPFNSRNPGWDDDPEFTKFYLICAKATFRNLLATRGHLFLNEVYDYLGYDRTFEGQVKGWIFDPDEDKTFFMIDDKLILTFITDGYIIANLRSESDFR